MVIELNNMKVGLWNTEATGNHLSCFPSTLIFLQALDVNFLMVCVEPLIILMLNRAGRSPLP